MSSGFSLSPQIQGEEQLPSWLVSNSLGGTDSYKIKSTLPMQKIDYINMHRHSVSGQIDVFIYGKQEFADEFAEAFAGAAGRTHSYPWSQTYHHHSSFERNGVEIDSRFNQLLGSLTRFEPSLGFTELQSIRNAFIVLGNRPVESGDRLVIRPQRIIGTAHHYGHYPLRFSRNQPHLQPARSQHAITLDAYQDLEIDDAMICPISLEIMDDPVYFAGLASNNAQRFERTQITKILLQSNPAHPLTREPISLAQMRGDDDLRRRIEEFVALVRSPAQIRNNQ